ncbi:hypothetical protein H9X54_001215, partial [Flavobacterium macrobrachii]
CGVKVFFPCMSKFKKNQIYLQGFVYLSCATRTAVWRKRGFTVTIRRVVLSGFEFPCSICVSKSPPAPSGETLCVSLKNRRQRKYRKKLFLFLETFITFVTFNNNSIE